MDISNYSFMFVVSKRNKKMKKLKNTTTNVAPLEAIIKRQNGTQAGINALAESLKRGLK